MVAPARLVRILAFSAALGGLVASGGQAAPVALPERATVGHAFEAVRLSEPERRILQVALAFTGDYSGPLDGIWDEASEAALADYSAREFASPVKRAHVAALMLTFLAEADTRGWQYTYFGDHDISLALPGKLFGEPESEDHGQRWWSPDGGLTLLVHGFEPDMAVAWHSAARGANADPADLETLDSATASITSGLLEDGRSYHTTTLRHGETWPTIYMAAEPGAEPFLQFIRSTLVRGPVEPWVLPTGGKLEAAIQQTITRFGQISEFDSFLPPDPAAVSPPESNDASGTAFFVGPRVLLTANHVVQSCGKLGLADGTRLKLLASDSELDIAALAADTASPAWLSISGALQSRLGEKLHAAGYPYYNIAGTSLHLTSGNVSSLADVNDDRRFFSFSAPVQPGNSGGPLIDRDGGVMGLVVSRLSERFIAEATGTLPQNINYGLSRSELVRFLDRNKIAPERAGLAEFDMEEGVPDGFEAAIVPVLCG